MAINLNVISKFDDKGIKQAKGETDKLSSTLKTLGGVLVAAFSVKAIADFTKEAVLAGEAVKTANARIANIADSMGIFGTEADKVTQRLIDYAEANELTVAVDAEVIKATQAKLLTFKELANTADEAGGSFDRATQAAVDLAAAGFGQAETNAIQLGKALNDPIKGITALTRSGVTFTESEKELIKTLVESGDTLAAQDMILKAIETQVGGTAAATADASVIMGLAFDNIKETVGVTLSNAFDTLSASLVPLIQTWMPQLEAFLTNTLGPVINRAAEGLAGFIDGIGNGTITVGTFLESLIEMRNKLILAFIEALPKIVQTLVSMVPQILDTAIKLFTSLIDAVIKITPILIQTIVDLLPVLIKSVLSLLPQLAQAAVKLFTAIVEALPKIIPPLIEAIIDLTPVIVDTLIQMLPTIIDAAFKLFSGLLSAFYKSAPELIAALAGLLPKLRDTIFNFIPKFFEAGFEIIKGLAKGIVENGPRVLGDAITGVVNGVINTAKNLLGIRSPSKVFTEFGENIGQGLVNGMTVMFNGVKATAKELAALAAAPTAETLKKLGITSTYTGYGESVFIPTLSGEQYDVGMATNDLNDAYKAANAKTVSAMNKIQQEMFGTSFQQHLDNITGQRTLYNPKTGMSQTIGASDPQSLEAAVARAVADGFVPNVKLATGGIVTGPTTALIGEAGPEAVIPLDRLGSMGGNFYITVNAGMGTDGADVGAKIVDAIKRYERRSGRVFVAA